MYKNKTRDNRNNICGSKIKEIRKKLPEKTSQRKLADMLQMAGLDIDKNAVQRMENTHSLSQTPRTFTKYSNNLFKTILSLIYSFHALIFLISNLSCNL